MPAARFRPVNGTASTAQPPRARSKTATARRAKNRRRFIGAALCAVVRTRRPAAQEGDDSEHPHGADAVNQAESRRLGTVTAPLVCRRAAGRFRARGICKTRLTWSTTDISRSLLASGHENEGRSRRSNTRRAAQRDVESSVGFSPLRVTRALGLRGERRPWPRAASSRTPKKTLAGPVHAARVRVDEFDRLSPGARRLVAVARTTEAPAGRVG